MTRLRAPKQQTDPRALARRVVGKYDLHPRLRGRAPGIEKSRCRRAERARCGPRRRPAIHGFRRRPEGWRHTCDPSLRPPPRSAWPDARTRAAARSQCADILSYLYLEKNLFFKFFILFYEAPRFDNVEMHGSAWSRYRKMAVFREERMPPLALPGLDHAPTSAENRRPAADRSDFSAH